MTFDASDSSDGTPVPFASDELPRLGLVCLSYTPECRFRTITRARYLALRPDQRPNILRELYWDNLRRLHWTLGFCVRRGIRLYRLTSAMFPMSDGDLGGRVLREEMASVLSSVGRRAQRLGMRLVLHPDQFVVLNSESRRIANTSRKILQKHAMAFDLMGLPRSPWSLMNVHGGRGGRAKQLIEAIGRLPENVKSRLTLENDEYTYSAADILAICRSTGVPMVFDCHHHVIKEKLASYNDPSVADFTAAAKDTWPDPSWQLVHVSNGSGSFLDRNHALHITAMPAAFRDVPWVEVEARGKECAIARLHEQWPTADVPTEYAAVGESVDVVADDA